MGFPKPGLIHRVKWRLGSTSRWISGRVSGRMGRASPEWYFWAQRSRTPCEPRAGYRSSAAGLDKGERSDIGMGRRARATGGGGGSGSKFAGALRELALNLGTGTPGRVGISGVLGFARPSLFRPRRAAVTRVGVPSGELGCVAYLPAPTRGMKINRCSRSLPIDATPFGAWIRTSAGCVTLALKSSAQVTVMAAGDAW